MGMAASQARYLGLTARKTNVEYEGQQVNQQRTALANQSANLFNLLMAVELPVPPSVSDYTKVQYSYNDGFNTETITGEQPINEDGYNYLITHHHISKVYTGNQEIIQNPQVYAGVKNNTTIPENKPMVEYDAVNDKYYMNNTAAGALDGVELEKYDPTNEAMRKIYEELRDAGLVSPNQNEVKFYTDPNTGLVNFTDDTRLKDVIASDPDITKQKDLDFAVQSYDGYRIGTSDVTPYDPTNKVDKLAIDQIKKDQKGTNFANAADNEIFKYEKYGKTYYVCKADLDKSIQSATTTDNQVNLNQYTASDIEKKFEKIERAVVEKDGQGRITNIRFENSTATYQVHTEQIKDEQGYEDAFNKYTYGVEQYEQKIQELNTKTKIIQQQDRTLELRLKQLDTEQKALQTEMEAVAKVIQKNVETTFKTFS